MAHQFLIERKKDKKEAWFLGFAEGVFYKQFHCEEFNGMISGRNQGKTIPKKTAESALKRIIESEEIKNYPDPERINEIKDFYFNVVLNSNDTDTFYIHYY